MDVRDHSIYFGDYNTWDEWHLVPSSRPTPTVPAARTNYVNIPGRNGSLDLTEALTGYTVYDDRTIEGEFILYDQSLNWMDVYQDIMLKLHGKKMKIRLIDDMNWYYVGRVTVNDLASNSDFSSITISATVEPYKYCDIPTVVDEMKLYIKDLSVTDKVGQVSINIGKKVTSGMTADYDIGDTTSRGSEFFHYRTPLDKKSNILYEPTVEIIESTTPLNVSLDGVEDIFLSNSVIYTIGDKPLVISSPWKPITYPIVGKNGGSEYDLIFKMVCSQSTDWSNFTDNDYIVFKMIWPERSL